MPTRNDVFSSAEQNIIFCGHVSNSYLFTTREIFFLKLFYIQYLCSKFLSAQILFRMLILESNSENQFKFYNCKSLHKKVRYFQKMKIETLKIELVQLECEIKILKHDLGEQKFRTIVMGYNSHLLVFSGKPEQLLLLVDWLFLVRNGQNLQILSNIVVIYTKIQVIFVRI